MSNNYIEINNLTKVFKSLRREVVALRDVDFEIPEGEFFVVLGPSGCGKSTLLNIVAGLEAPTEGEVAIADELVASPSEGISLAPKERNVAMVFQSYALYPHLNAFDNIAFPLDLSDVSDDEIEERVRQIANMLDIEDLLEAKPKQLSGGQKQRVAMARALIRHPKVFLLDEPLSNLDAQLRVRLREELKKLQKKLDVTALYVTHDQSEAMTLGDRIAILRDGEIQQIGKPMDVYNQPVNTFVAGFIGVPPMNLWNGTLSKPDKKSVKISEELTFPLNEEAQELLSNKDVDDLILGIRPEHIEIGNQEGQISLQNTIEFVERLGSEVLLTFYFNETKLLAKCHRTKGFSEGMEVTLSISRQNLHFFSREGNRIN